jgi:hypothetical protein
LLELINNDVVIPVDEFLKINILPHKITVPMMLEIAFWAQNQSSYEATEQIIKKIYNITINDDLIRNVTEHIGEIIFNRDTEKAIQDYNALTKSVLNRPKPFKDYTLYIEVDGAAINTREKNEDNSSWRENKLCIIFSSDNIRYWTNSKTGEREHRINKREYTSYIGSADEFQKYVYSCALKNGFEKYKKIVLISDGATWIRKLKDDLFPEAQQILDFFHLIENLYTFAKSYFNKDESKYIPWVTRYKHMLKQGYHLDVVDELSKLEKSKLENCSINIHNYLHNNINSINYKSYLDQNLFIGSGAIESGNKIVLQKRLKCAGMRWNVDSAQKLLTLKAKNESGIWFEEVIKPVCQHYGITI